MSIKSFYFEEKRFLIRHKVFIDNNNANNMVYQKCSENFEPIFMFIDGIKIIYKQIWMIPQKYLQISPKIN